ncbi:MULTISPECIES: glutathione S-transferase [unclassified Bradyrhizobium]|uniref:glutathione S-transferase n=1 Tax=unclassified Bradyrhizobium TaxID=2631580 RepID=UPI002478FA6A|nr:MULTISPECIES: glutathione S-transferase [unclassified Bradyrhizobium]WGS21290.1 glutathione S-transferase [Bradyrhizobium sp. ISRA463]WGS28218.1 glutathione S-transferase [Bradyrhizobium sp. ISRA464]
MADLRIFSYLPNPRVWKATIAARFCGVDVEVRGASSKELRDWLWDYDARPLAEEERQSLASLARTGRVGLTSAQLFKTDAFMEAQPFGNVPAAFGRDGTVGIFESNSIMRAVARLGEAAFPLYGRDAYEASRIDSFLDVSLVFARDSQIYLLALADGSVDAAIHARAKLAFAIYASGLEQALSPRCDALVGDSLSLADICFAAELALFMNEHARAVQLNERGLDKILHAGVENDYPRVFAHFARLIAHQHFKPDLGPYVEKLLSKAAA